MAGLAADLGVGVHIHVGEDAIDAGAADRLRPLATDDWLLAHCVHVDPPLAGHDRPQPPVEPQQRGRLRPPGPCAGAGNRVVLGSDGIGAAMVDEFALAYVAQRADDVDRHARRRVVAGCRRAPTSCPRCGATRSPGRPTGPTRGTWPSRPGVRAERVVVDGEVVVDGGGCTRVDAERIRARAWEEAQRLWSRL